MLISKGDKIISERNSVSFSPDGRYVCDNRYGKIWNVLQKKIQLDCPRRILAFCKDGNRVIGSFYDSLNYWNLHSGALVNTIILQLPRENKGGDSQFIPLVYSADAKFLVTGSDNGTTIFDTKDGQPIDFIESSYDRASFCLTIDC